MRLSKRLLLLGVMVLTVGLVTSLTAWSTERTPLPDGDRIDVHAGDRQIGEGEPFYFSASLGLLGGRVNSRRYQAHLFMDGVELEPTFVGCTDLEVRITECIKTHFWDFPDGLDGGVYQFDMKWIAPCEAWIGAELMGLEIQSCLHDQAPMSNLQRQMHLAVGAPDISATPVDWFIHFDTFGPGVHSIFTIAEFRPLTEEAIQNVYGSLVWDDTVVDLCGVEVRDVGDDYVHVGDGYETTEGCEPDPTAMQDAFDAFGRAPDVACVGVTAFGSDFEYCAPLDEP